MGQQFGSHETEPAQRFSRLNKRFLKSTSRSILCDEELFHEANSILAHLRVLPPGVERNRKGEIELGTIRAYYNDLLNALDVAANLTGYVAPSVAPACELDLHLQVA